VSRCKAAIYAVVLTISAFTALPKAEAVNADPVQLTFIAVQGGPNPPTQAVLVSKSKKLDLNLVTSYSPSWLGVALSPGHRVPSDQLVVSVDVAGLAAGVHTGMVTIAATKDEWISIPVTLNIAARPAAVTTSSAANVMTAAPVEGKIIQPRPVPSTVTKKGTATMTRP